MNLRLPVALLSLCVAASCVPHEAERPAAVRADPKVVEARAFVDRLAFGAPSTMPPTIPALPDAPAADSAAAPPFLATRSTDDAARAADCLATAIYYEARSEPRDGQRAVAQVVLNRVRDRAFPASVCGVVYQGSERRTGCQFSFTCDGSMLRGRRDEGAWERARDVAAAALAGDVYAPVGSATFYHTTAILPWWAPSLARIGAVGSHIFYRWRNALERSLAFRQRYSGDEPGIAAPAPALIAATDQAATDPAGNDLVYRVTREGQVTVHRALAVALAKATEPAGTVAEPTAAPRRLPPSAMAGVRIHRNAETPIVADET